MEEEEDYFSDGAEDDLVAQAQSSFLPEKAPVGNGVEVQSYIIISNMIAILLLKQ